MATKTKGSSPKPRQIQHPKQRAAKVQQRWLLYEVAAVALVVLTVVVALISLRGGGTSADRGSAGLPDTPDYHSLLVDPSDPQKLVLGTHDGLYGSSDGGRHWRFDALSGDDAMNLARPQRNTIWLAGHEVFKRSTDGGAGWSDVKPAGLPSLDIHGFAVDPRNPAVLYAALAGRGLYRSRDGGRSFSLASEQVGGNVMALAVLPDGRILAGDMQHGLLQSSDAGQSWKQMLQAQLMGLAVNPSDPNRLLATGAGIALSDNGGSTWRSVLDLPDGAGPVAWSKSNPQVAYAVGFDRTFYRSSDGGKSWQPVVGS
jgi:photosynthesis system II assembly factor YCF48-like protein